MNTKWLYRSGIIVLLAVLACMAAPLKAQEQEPDDALMEKFSEGQSLIQEEEYAKAAEVLQKCVDENDKFGPGWFLLGYALHMDGKYEAALKAHRRAAEFDNNFKPIATYNIACALALTGKTQEAMESLREAIELGFTDANKIQTDSDLYSLHPSTEFAKIVADLNADEDRVKALDEAQEHIGQGEFDKAAEIYKSIVEKDPNDDFSTYRLGYSLHGAGKLDEAIDFHKKATEFPGTQGIALYNWGCALSLKGDKDPAIEKLQDAVKHGFLRIDAYENDPDLDNLREEQTFKDLVAKVKSKAKAEPQVAKDEEAEEEEANESESKAEEDEDEDAEEKEGKAEEKDDAEEAAPMNKFSIGIQMNIVDDEGVIVEEVLPDSAAERDGLKSGDRLVKANDVELGDDPLSVLRPFLSSGDKIIFEVERDGKTVKVEVKPKANK